VPTRARAAQPAHWVMYSVRHNPPHSVDKVNAAMPHGYVTFGDCPFPFAEYE